MQRVSMQLVDILTTEPDVELSVIKLEAKWGSIGYKTTLFLFDLVATLPTIVERDKPDVILFSSMVTASLAPFIRGRTETPMVTINHGHDVTLPIGIYQWFLKYVFRSLDGVISVSRATRQACIDRGMDPDKGVALPNGFSSESLDLDGCDKNISREKISDLTGINLQGKKILLTTGRLIRRKGHQWFIEQVLPLLTHDVTYLVVGDGSEMEAIKSSVQRTRQQNKVILLGRQSDEILSHCYCAADLFIMPNIKVPGDMEGFGVVMLEANLRNTPVVASDLEGIVDVVEPGVNGYRINPGDSLNFASTIDRVLKSELMSLSETCRNYVLEHFTWEKVSKRYIHYLQNVIVKSKN